MRLHQDGEEGAATRLSEYIADHDGSPHAGRTGDAESKQSATGASCQGDALPLLTVVAAVARNRAVHALAALRRSTGGGHGVAPEGRLEWASVAPTKKTDRGRVGHPRASCMTTNGCLLVGVEVA